LRGLAVGGLGLVAAPLLAACGAPQTAGGGPAVSKPVSAEAVKAGGQAVGATTTVDMNDQNKFVPESITIKKGASVTWKNVGVMVHNVQTDPTGIVDAKNAKSPAGAKPFASPMIEAGKTWSHTFDVVGEYTYVCLPHQTMGMVGKVIVTD
jgi:plastocyanin